MKISLKVKKLNDFQSILGLIPYLEPISVYFETRFGIHTFGVAYPIDVLILNDKNEVVSLKTDLKPFGFYFWDPAYSRVLELPEGTIKAKKIHLHDTIELE